MWLSIRHYNYSPIKLVIACDANTLNFLSFLVFFLKNAKITIIYTNFITTRYNFFSPLTTRWLIIAKIVSIFVFLIFFLYNNPIGHPTNCDKSWVSFCGNTLFFFSFLIRWAGQPIQSKPSTFPSPRVKIQTTNLHYPSS